MFKVNNKNTRTTGYFIILLKEDLFPHCGNFFKTEYLNLFHATSLMPLFLYTLKLSENHTLTFTCFPDVRMFFSILLGLEHCSNEGFL